MVKDFSNKNLQKTSFLNEDLSGSNFENSDLRGVDFTGANLSGARFKGVKTGIVPLNVILIFILSLAISLLSGYIAMLAGHTVQLMLKSGDPKIRTSGIVTVIVIVVFIVYFWRKGGSAFFYDLIISVVVVALIVGLISYFSGYGTGHGMLYLILAIILVAVMFSVGTISRAAAGTLSSTILFLAVALGGGLFGKSVGGGIGTTMMAICCVQISKRALKGTKGFDNMQNLAAMITSKLGTSFRNANLSHADFTGTKQIRNVDFTGANVSSVNWGNSKKMNCIINATNIPYKKMNKEQIN